MNKILLILIIGIFFMPIINAKETELNGNFCGNMKDNKLISYNQNPECFCQKNSEKIEIWVQPFCPEGKLCVQWCFLAYSCKKWEINT